MIIYVIRLTKVDKSNGAINKSIFEYHFNQRKNAEDWLEEAKTLYEDVVLTEIIS